MSAVWVGVRLLHELAMALFVGGQLFLVAVVLPVERTGQGRERLRAMARRFGWATLLAVAVLLATGSAMATHFHQWGQSTLQIKLGLVALVGALLVWHMRRPERRVLDGAIFVISLAIVWLGIALAH